MTVLKLISKYMPSISASEKIKIHFAQRFPSYSRTYGFPKTVGDKIFIYLTATNIIIKISPSFFTAGNIPKLM